MIARIWLLIPALVVCFLKGAEVDAQRHTTRTHVLKRGESIEAYHPPSVFETYYDGLVSSRQSNPEEAVLQFINNKLNTSLKWLSQQRELRSELFTVSYFPQTHNGIPFANAGAHVTQRDGKIFGFASSFVEYHEIAPTTPTINLTTYLPDIEDRLGGTKNSKDPKLEYLARPDGSARLVYVVEIENLHKAIYYEAFIDAHSGELLSVNNLVVSASYFALPLSEADLSEGQKLLVDPQDLTASPLGWHNTGAANYSYTSGNNVQAFKYLDPGYTYPEPTSGKIFNYTYDPLLEPVDEGNVLASVTNTFYVMNKMHDVSYIYGFTENAFNFQVTNFQGNMKGNDPVRVSVQAPGVGENNAFFATPMDGTAGFAQILLWKYSTPDRDGGIANDILVHEFAHGITNRMTGGGTERCLQSDEAQGLGEGWSDVIAEWAEQSITPSRQIADWTFGSYVANSSAGLRIYPYSTNSTINPWRYSSLANLPEPHDAGEVWANVLHNLYAKLVKVHGWSYEALTHPSGDKGNVVFFHIVVDALPLQPCNPTYIQARDAIFLADELRYGGKHKCLMWRIFASRGFGLNAHDFVDDEGVPSECK